MRLTDEAARPAPKRDDRAPAPQVKGKKDQCSAPVPTGAMAAALARVIKR